MTVRPRKVVLQSFPVVPDVQRSFAGVCFLLGNCERAFTRATALATTLNEKSARRARRPLAHGLCLVALEPDGVHAERHRTNHRLVLAPPLTTVAAMKRPSLSGEPGDGRFPC